MSSCKSSFSSEYIRKIKKRMLKAAILFLIIPVYNIINASHVTYLWQIKSCGKPNRCQFSNAPCKDLTTCCVQHRPRCHVRTSVLCILPISSLFINQVIEHTKGSHEHIVLHKSCPVTLLV